MNGYLKLKGIDKYYRIAGKRKHIIDGIDLEIASGEICSLTGKSGCGKTTLLNVISGITSPDRGSVYLNGKRIVYALDLLSSSRRNRDIGFIFQTFKLLPYETVLSNVLLPARIRGHISKETREYVNEIMGKLKIYKFRKTKTGILSGGQKQRVALARALVNSPKLILADEPTANLDKKTSIEIFDIIYDLKNQDKAILIVTHKDYMHDRSDVVFNMENGRLKALK